jgi:hypothetical protein
MALLLLMKFYITRKMFCMDIFCRVGKNALSYKAVLLRLGHRQNRGARYLTGENLEVVWAEFSTLS